MKAITLHQPWATLVALGVKTIETRSWKPPAALIGERLVIHAANRNPFVEGPDRVGEFVVGTDGSPYIRKVRGGLTIKEGMGYPVPLPLGAIVASCTLAAAVPMDDEDADIQGAGVDRLIVLDDALRLYRYDPSGLTGVIVDCEDQRPYGDFAPGRWAWLLDDVKPTTERCPACWGRGHGLRPSAPGQPVLAQAISCSLCRAGGACPPIQTKGHQRVWNWTP